MVDPELSPALRVPPADPVRSAAYFAARLAFHVDVADVHASLSQADPGFVLIDSRGAAGWAQGHLPGAVHLPTAQLPERAAAELDPRVPVIVYCWGPGCDGATRAALALARLGYQVKEMIGGIEYWVREGFPLEGPAGLERGPIDPLTAPAARALVRVLTVQVSGTDHIRGEAQALPVDQGRGSASRDDADSAGDGPGDDRGLPAGAPHRGRLRGDAGQEE